MNGDVKDVPTEVALSKIEINIETITPTAAKEYMKKNLHNRRISNDSVAFYADQMTKGKWMLSPEGISFDSRGILLDGQHRLLAIIRSNTKQRFVVSRGFDSDTFKVINTGKIRNGADTLHIEGITNASLVYAGLRKYYSLKSGTSTRQSNKEMKLSNAMVIEMYESDADFYKNISTFANRQYGKLKILSNSEIMGYSAFLIKDKLHEQGKVDTFFEELVTVSDSQPINMLRTELYRSKLSTRKMSAAEKDDLVAQTWNCYITDTPLKSLKYNPKRKTDFI